MLLLFACSESPPEPPVVPSGITAVARYGGQAVPLESFVQTGLAGTPTIPWIDVRGPFTAVHAGLDAPWLDHQMEFDKHGEPIFAIQAVLLELRMEAGLRGEELGPIPVVIHPDTKAERVARVFDSLEAAEVSNAMILVDPSGAPPAPPAVFAIPFDAEATCTGLVHPDATWASVVGDWPPDCSSFGLAVPAPPPKMPRELIARLRFLGGAFGKRGKRPPLRVGEVDPGDLNPLLIRERVEDLGPTLSACGAERVQATTIVMNVVAGRVDSAHATAGTTTLSSCLTPQMLEWTFSPDATGTFSFTLEPEPTP